MEPPARGRRAVPEFPPRTYEEFLERVKNMKSNPNPEYEKRMVEELAEEAEKAFRREEQRPKGLTIQEQDQMLLSLLTQAVEEFSGKKIKNVIVDEFRRLRGRTQFRIVLYPQFEDGSEEEWEFDIKCEEPLRMCQVSVYVDGILSVMCYKKCAGIKREGRDLGRILAEKLNKIMTNPEDKPFES